MSKKLNSHGWQVREKIMDREAFETHGALSAVVGRVDYLGYLPDKSPEYATIYRDADVVYTVLSYNTPIAWVELKRDEEVVVIPDVKYSRTTTRHQGLLYALDLTLPQRVAIRDRAREEEQRDRDRAAARREARRDAVAQGYTPGGYYSIERTEWEYVDPRPAQVLPLATEDPTASLEDRIAALEAQTFAQIDTTEALMRRATDALRNA